MEQILIDSLAELGLGADARALALFRDYYNILTEKNAVMNLTAITGEENTARLHFLDCCALLRAAEFKGRRVLDVGSGAGFPGLPLLIAEPDMELTMLDSLEKRVTFLRETCNKLGLSAACIACRAEEAPAAMRGSYDLVVSRAVSRLCLLSELCLPFVKVGGVFLAMKGPDCAEELEEAKNAIATLGGECEDTFTYRIPGTDISHSVVRVRKRAPTPEKYPRRWAKMQKQPL